MAFLLMMKRNYLEVKEASSITASPKGSYCPQIWGLSA
jgi:hypothetical protein